MSDELRELTGPAVVQTVATFGPIQIGDLVCNLRSQGYDTSETRLVAMLGALRRSGRLMLHEGLWTYSVIGVLRLDEQQTATLHLIYEALDTLCSSVNELVRMLTPMEPNRLARENIVPTEGDEVDRLLNDPAYPATAPDVDMWECRKCGSAWLDGEVVDHSVACEGEPVFIPGVAK